MPNSCYDGHWWWKQQDEEGNFLDWNGNIIYTWMDWTDVMGQAIDDQMCATKAATLTEAATAASSAIATAVAAIPAAAPPTEAQVKTALGAPKAAITAPSGAAVATVTVLGLTVLAGATGDIITNMRTRISDLEARLKSLELIS